LEANSKSDVLIVGGGVIGLACAYELARRGVGVTVIDKGEMGHGCSYGNAGWITPCFAMPLPMPGMLLKSIGWLLDPDSPLYIKPAPSRLLAQWLVRFLLAMNHRQMERSVAALTEISKYSSDAYKKLEGETGHPFGLKQQGLLMAAQSKAGFKYAVEEMRLVADHGIPGRSLEVDELRAFEPALTGELAGGVFFPDEMHAEPLEVTRALAKGAQKHGAKLLSQTEIIDFQTEAGRIVSARTTRGIFKADQFVLALGAWSTPLASSLGLNVPVLGGKGYALITQPLSKNPSRPLMLVEKKVAVTPRDGTLRLAGTLELVKGDFLITPRRVDAIIRGAREFLSVPESFEYSEIWRGLRPCTPDGVPVIGYPKKHGNLLVCTGHQMLGLQSAPGSGRLAADLLTGQTPPFDPTPFRATRF
jgi:D-amino-acid dehydrogenase